MIHSIYSLALAALPCTLHGGIRALGCGRNGPASGTTSFGQLGAICERRLRRQPSPIHDLEGMFASRGLLDTTLGHALRHLGHLASVLRRDVLATIGARHSVSAAMRCRRVVGRVVDMARRRRWPLSRGPRCCTRRSQPPGHRGSRTARRWPWGTILCSPRRWWSGSPSHSESPSGR